jgi:hypothetical protein
MVKSGLYMQFGSKNECQVDEIEVCKYKKSGTNVALVLEPWSIKLYELEYRD